MKRILLILILSVVLLSCKSRMIKTLNNAVDTDFYSNQFTGIFIYDPATKDTVYTLNSEKYFTPASNVKIVTLFSALKTLPDSIPALKYIKANDTLFVKGTGDPTLLHPYFKDSTAFKFFSEHHKVGLYLDNFDDDHYGPGWAWEDYDTYFSPERSGFPMYGNVLQVSKNSKLTVTPKYFQDSVTVNRTTNRRRLYNDNVFFYNKEKDTIEIPMIISNTLIQDLWEEALPNKVFLTRKLPNMEMKTLYSIPSDSLYKRMMTVSDNFLAEQLLMLVSSTISDNLNSARARHYILKEHLKSMKQRPRWVDGSGLSRYNLFTPESIVFVLNRMYQELPRERLLGLFPGVDTMVSTESPEVKSSSRYVYAKSGTVGNNYSLSGYLLTTSGKTLIFSFMNNHYMKSTSDVRKRLYGFLEKLRDSY